MFLDPILKVLRAPLDLIRSKVFGVTNLKGGIKGDISRAKNLGAEYKQGMGMAQGAASKIPAAPKTTTPTTKKKKMGIFGKKNKGGDGGSDDQNPGPSQQPQGGNNRTMALDMGSSAPAGTNVGWLVPLEGLQAGELFSLNKARCVVGTAADCDVVLTDPSISSRHAEFISMAGGFRINDLGSTNGTFVNDKRVSSHDLVDNDNVRLGRTPFKFKSMN